MRAPDTGRLWRDPRPPAPSRYATVAFVVCAAVLASAAFAAGLTARSPGPAPPITGAARPAVVMAPSCGSAAAARPLVLAPPTGRVDSFSVDGRAVLAYMPVSYLSLPGVRLPVVYFLHGSPGAAPDWIDGARLPTLLDRMQALGQLPPLIAVLPDGRGADGSWWGNTLHGAALESWFVDRLVPAVDRRFRTLGAAQRGIAGVSAGGFGAVNLAIHHPGVFTWVASYSGVFTAQPDLFGRAAAANSPSLTVSVLPAARRFPLFVGAGADDGTFRPESDQFIGTVRWLGWAPLQAEIVPGGHGWDAWAVEVRDSLAWLGRLWSADPSMMLSLSRTAVQRSCP
jgi:enterochelin esterase-like enzyme